jgi:hypothetical protein
MTTDNNMIISESKRGCHIVGDGLRQTAYINPAKQPIRKLKILAELPDGTLSRTFNNWKDAVNFVNRYLPKGYAVIRYYEPVCDSWLNFRTHYTPWYQGKHLKLTNPMPYTQQKRRGKKPALLQSFADESSATCFNIGNLKCY